MSEPFATFEISMMVDTEVMEFDGAHLVPATSASESAYAGAFSTWFTKHYSAIAQETETDEFAEIPNAEFSVLDRLKKLAFVAAAALYLRDKGQPLPLCISQHRAMPYETPSTTPALTVSRTTTDDSVRAKYTTRSAYGGATLGGAPGSETVAAADRRTEMLGRTASSMAQGARALQQKVFTFDQRSYSLFTLPGDYECRQDSRGRQIDLALVAETEEPLRLERRYANSYGPPDSIGMGWVIDLPRLTDRRRRLTRGVEQQTFEIGYAIEHPTLGWNQTFWRFATTLPHAVVGIIKTSRVPEGLTVLGFRSRLLDQQSRVLWLQNGERLHFSEAGDLLMWVRESGADIYFRNDGRAVVKIERMVDGRSVGWIDLSYDRQAQLETATASDGQSVQYEMTPHALAMKVESPGGTYLYQYDADGVLTQSRAADLATDQSIVQEEFEQGPSTSQPVLAAFAAASSSLSAAAPVHTHPGRHSNAKVGINGDTSKRRMVRTVLKNYRGQVEAVRNCDLLARASSCSVTRVSRTSSGELLSVENSVGRRRLVLEYEGGFARRIVDYSGNSLSIEYDQGDQQESLRLRRLGTPDGTQLRYSYDDVGRLIKVAVGLRRTIVYTYDVAGRLASIVMKGRDP